MRILHTKALLTAILLLWVNVLIIAYPNDWITIGAIGTVLLIITWNRKND